MSIDFKMLKIYLLCFRRSQLWYRRSRIQLQ